MNTIQKVVGKDMSEYPLFSLYKLIDVIIWCPMCIVTAAKDLKVTRMSIYTTTYTCTIYSFAKVPGHCICEPAEFSHSHQNPSPDPEFRARSSLFS